MSRHKAAANDTEAYWINLETAFPAAKEFEAKAYVQLQKELPKVNKYKLPWNKELKPTRERNCTTDECHTSNGYPVWALELLSCFTKEGSINCALLVTYEPIERLVYVHWDCSLENQFSVKEDGWIKGLAEELTRIHKDGHGFRKSDPRQRKMGRFEAHGSDDDHESDQDYEPSE